MANGILGAKGTAGRRVCRSCRKHNPPGWCFGEPPFEREPDANTARKAPPVDRQEPRPRQTDLQREDRLAEAIHRRQLGHHVLRVARENSKFGGKGQPVLNASAEISQKNRASGSRGDDRIVYQPSERESIAVTNGSRGYSFRCVGNRVPPFRQEEVGQPKPPTGRIDDTADAGKPAVLGEIKRSGDKNAFSAFVQLLTYLSEMATKNQVRRAARHKEFGIPLGDLQPFDLHILIAHLDERGATLGLIEPTRRLAELLRARLGKH